MTMLISLLVAAAENNVIGRNNQLPWHLPNDLKYFKNMTWGMPVVMGRKTFESFHKPLKGRTNIVITRQPDWKQAGVIVARDISSALQAAASETDAKEVFVIGGGQIFQEILEKADRLYITRVHANVKGDVVFPPIPENEWKLLSSRDMDKDDQHEFAYSFQVWVRKEKRS
jgi:dihydrofolate reductase